MQHVEHEKERNQQYDVPDNHDGSEFSEFSLCLIQYEAQYRIRDTVENTHKAKYRTNSHDRKSGDTGRIIGDKTHTKQEKIRCTVVQCKKCNLPYFCCVIFLS